jgi:hypothetical protein
MSRERIRKTLDQRQIYYKEKASNGCIIGKKLNVGYYHRNSFIKKVKKLHSLRDDEFHIFGLVKNKVK